MTSPQSENGNRVKTNNRLGGAARSLVALCLSSVLCGTTGLVVGAVQSSSQTSQTVVAADSSSVSLPILDTLPLAESTETSTPTTISPTTSPPKPVVAAPRQDSTVASDIDPGKTLATAKITNGTVQVFSEPNGIEVAWSLAAPTEFGGPRHFLVIGESDGWLEIQVPVRPNGSVGWIKRSSVTVAPVPHRVRVDLSDRSVVVWENDEIVFESTVAVGRDSAPTPVGSFYIRDIIDWTPESVYGPRVLALSSFSEAIDQINGGDAVVAIHGTNAPWDLGKAVSLGCIRLDNEMVLALADLVGPGTPIEVVA